MYIKEILTYLGWPFFIYLTYKLSLWAIRIYEKKYPINESVEKTENLN